MPTDHHPTCLCSLSRWVASETHGTRSQRGPVWDGSPRRAARCRSPPCAARPFARYPGRVTRRSTIGRRHLTVRTGARALRFRDMFVSAICKCRGLLESPPTAPEHMSFPGNHPQLRSLIRPYTVTRHDLDYQCAEGGGIEVYWSCTSRISLNSS